MTALRKWAPAGVVVFLASVIMVLTRPVNPELLRDSDTKVLLETISQVQNPWHWFTNDWPLRNHFYRPISTLPFEWDLALHGSNAGGYSLTNALLAAVGVGLVAWWLREFTDSVAATTAGTAIFTLWLVGGAGWLLVPWPFLPWVILVWGAVRHGKDARRYLPAFFLLTFLPYELAGIEYLRYTILQWIPGRTASAMAIFTMSAVAAYCRYVRLANPLPAREPGPLDPPATRSSGRLAAPPKGSLWPWIGLVHVSVALALGAYEQAVMLPAVITGLAVSFWWQGRRVSLWLALSTWAWLPVYWLVRRAFVPSAVSQYQDQQFRSGPGVWGSISEYIAVPFGSFANWQSYTDAGPLILLTSGPYTSLLFVAAFLVTFWVGIRDRWVATGWILSFLAYLPMGWLHQFGHYHYWPLMLRTIAVVGLLLITGRAMISAVSPRRQLAPPRPHPAPGSLPRP